MIFLNITPFFRWWHMLTIISSCVAMFNKSSSVHNHKRDLERLQAILNSPELLNDRMMLSNNYTYYMKHGNSSFIKLQNDSMISLPSDAPDETEKEKIKKVAPKKLNEKLPSLFQKEEKLNTKLHKDLSNKQCIIRRILDYQKKSSDVMDLIWACIQMVIGLVILMGHLFWMICCLLQISSCFRKRNPIQNQLLTRSIFELQLHICVIGLVYAIVWIAVHLVLIGMDKKEVNFSVSNHKTCAWWTICGWSRKLLEALTTLYWLLVLGLLVLPSKCYKYMLPPRLQSSGIVSSSSTNYFKSQHGNKVKLFISLTHFIPWTIAAATHLLLHMLNEIHQYKLDVSSHNGSTVFVMANPPTDCSRSLQWNAAGITVDAFICISPTMGVFITGLSAYFQKNEHKGLTHLDVQIHSNGSSQLEQNELRKRLKYYEMTWHTYLLISFIALLGTLSGFGQFFINIITYIYYNVSKKEVFNVENSHTWLPVWLSRIHVLITMLTIGVLPFILCKRFSIFSQGRKQLSSCRRTSMNDVDTLLQVSNTHEMTNLGTNSPDDMPKFCHINDNSKGVSVAMVNLNTFFSNPVELLDIPEFTRLQFANLNTEAGMKLADNSIIMSTQDSAQTLSQPILAQVDANQLHSDIQLTSLTLQNPILQSSIITENNNTDHNFTSKYINFIKKDNDKNEQVVIAKPTVSNTDTIVSLPSTLN